MLDFHYRDDDTLTPRNQSKCSDAFNQICSEENVQAQLTLHPIDFRVMYIIKNFGPRRVQIMYDDYIYVLAPKEEVKVAFPGTYSDRPYIVALEDGVEAGWRD